MLARLPACGAALRRPRGARSISRSVGVVGLANVGKSSLFNALVCSQDLALVANYPFATIDPSTAAVAVADERLDTLVARCGSARAVPWQLELVDIAGLIRGASAGAGLGNAFLSHIRAVHAVAHVVRCFDDDRVIHVETAPDPARDADIVETELLLADLQTVEKRLVALRSSKAGRAGGAQTEATVALLEAAQAALDAGRPARSLEPGLDSRQLPLWHGLQLLTQKPMLYVANVDEAGAMAWRDAVERAAGGARGALSPAVAVEAARSLRNSSLSAARHVAALVDSIAAKQSAGGNAGLAALPHFAVVCVQLEAEAAILSDADRAAFLAQYGLRENALGELTAAMARLLRLQVFYTCGPSEARAWPIAIGTRAADAAGAIHTDFTAGFVRAEVTPYDAYVGARGEAGAKQANVTRVEGRDYVMCDGDVAVFRIASGTAAKDKRGKA